MFVFPNNSFHPRYKFAGGADAIMRIAVAFPVVNIPKNQDKMFDIGGNKFKMLSFILFTVRFAAEKCFFNV
jgi:mRNA-degrading endonuclease HigB of HigAB toxin-antitoxin module